MMIRANIKLKLAILVFSTICVLFSIPASGQGSEILRTDFEKNTEKWEARGTGSVSIKSSKKEAANGKKSLEVKGRTENWQGAQLNLSRVLSPGRSYVLSVSVKLNSGESPDEIKMTMQRGDNKFDGVASVNANDSQWSTFSGRFTPDGKDPYLLLYVEAIRPRTSFFIDDFKIEALESPKQTGTLLKNDFQDATAQNWFVRGENVLMFSAAVGDSRSLKVSGRSEPAHGLVVDVSPLLYKGRTYVMSVSAKLEAGESPDKLKITVTQTSPQGVATVVQVSPQTAVTDAEWVIISGEYEVTTEGNNLIVAVEAEGAKTSFYIDDFELRVK